MLGQTPARPPCPAGATSSCWSGHIMLDYPFWCFFQYLKADRAHLGAFSHRDASACPAVCPRGNSPLPPAGAAYRCAHRTERTADLRGWAASEWPAWGRFGVGGQRQRQTLPVNAAMASLAAASAANVTPPLSRTTDCALWPAWAADGLALGDAATLRAPQYRRIRGPSKMAVRRMVECWPRLNLEHHPFKRKRLSGLRCPKNKRLEPRP